MTGEKLEACWSCGAQPSVREREADEWIGSATMVSCDLAGCAGGEVWFTLEQWNRRTESAALKVERDAAISQMKSEERRADEALTELRLVQLRNGEKSSAIDFKTAQLWDSDQRVHQLETESAALRTEVENLRRALAIPHVHPSNLPGYDDALEDAERLRARVAELEKALEVSEKAHRMVCERARQGFDYWDADQNMKAGKCLKALAGLNPGYYPELDAARAAAPEPEPEPETGG